MEATIATKDTDNNMLALNTAENGTGMPELNNEAWDLGRGKQYDDDVVWSAIPYAYKRETDDDDEDAWSIITNVPESDVDDTAPRASEGQIDDQEDAWSTTANASENDLNDTSTAWRSESEVRVIILLLYYLLCCISPSSFSMKFCIHFQTLDCIQIPVMIPLKKYSRGKHVKKRS